MKFIIFGLALFSLTSINALPQLTAEQCVNLASTTFQCNPNNVSCPQQLKAIMTCVQSCLNQASSAQADCFFNCTKAASEISVISLGQNLYQCIYPSNYGLSDVTYNPNASNNTYTTYFDYCRQITPSPCQTVDYVCIQGKINADICYGNCYATTNISADLITCVQQKCTSSIDSVQNSISSIVSCASSPPRSSSSDSSSSTQKPLTLNQCITLAASTFKCNQNDQQCSAQLTQVIACGQNCLSQPVNAQNTCLTSCFSGITNIALLGVGNNIQQCVNPIPIVPPKVTYNPNASNNTYTTHFDYCKTINLNNCNPVDYTCQNEFSNIQICFANCYSTTKTASDVLSCAQQKCTSTVSTISNYVSSVIKCVDSTSSLQILTILSITIQLLIVILY